MVRWDRLSSRHWDCATEVGPPYSPRELVNVRIWQIFKRPPAHSLDSMRSGCTPGVIGASLETLSGNHGDMAKIVIVQPYVPRYRRPFFDAVMTELRAHGHHCEVVTGTLNRKRAARGDSVTAAWHKAHRGFSIRIRGRHFRFYSSWRDWVDADVVIVELATGSIDTYAALVAKGKRRVGVWGHVGLQTGQDSRALRRVETWQLRRADLVFAYTEAGRERAISRGSDRDLTMSLDNTVDLSGVRAAIARRAEAAEPTVYGTLQVRPGKTFVYIGGLDSSKRVDFLAEVMNRLWEADPEVRLLVGGSGNQAHFLTAAETRGQVEFLGRIGDDEKAYFAQVGDALLMPGRVGLVAAESFVLGLPIITTDWPNHAPEFEYLTPGHDCVVTANSVDAYVDRLLDLIESPDELGRLRANALKRSGWPTLEHMSQTFVRGCLDLVELNSRRPTARQANVPR